MTGKVAIKLHTGEPHGPNIIPRPWVKELIEKDLREPPLWRPTPTMRAAVLYHRAAPGDPAGQRLDLLPGGHHGRGRNRTAAGQGRQVVHRDGDGQKHPQTLDRVLGHSKGGFGGSNKNIGIGCADGRIGKAMIHTTPGSSDMWDISDEEFMERMTESAKAVVDHFGQHITFVNVMRNMSVSCDCEGTAAAPVVTPNVGILASRDILAIDQASVDLVYAMKEEDHKDLVERIESRHGLRQLSYMKELQMGNDRYQLIDIDNGDAVISPKDAVKDVVPFKE